MTVHSLPEPVQPDAVLVRQRQRGRWKMVALLLVCAAPVVVSYFTYYVLRPEGRRSFGELIEPQRSLPMLAATSLEGQSSSLQALKGQWLLLTVGSSACDAACGRRLYLQRQLREALGKDKDRLDRVWLITDEGPVDVKLLPALNGATVLRVDGAALAKWLVPAPGQRLDAHVYLVDPMGNWMMRFPANLDANSAAQARRDLNRVMRASASWDLAGR